MSGRDSGALSSVYAEALAAAAEARGELPLVGEELAGFAAAWRRHGDLRAFFLSGAVSREAKRRALERVAAGRTSATFADFLQVLLRRTRLFLLPEVAQAFAALLDRRLNRVPVLLTTAAPMADADLDAWRGRLRDALRKDPILTHEVRPALIGGAVLRVGDLVADGSVRRRLADLRARFQRASRFPSGGASS